MGVGKDEHLSFLNNNNKEVIGSFRGKKNFSAPRPDLAQNFWWNSFPSVHVNLADAMPWWAVEGRTFLNPNSGDLASPHNYRATTCLKTTYKIFTSILSSRLLNSISRVWTEIYESKGTKKEKISCRKHFFADLSMCTNSVNAEQSTYSKVFDTTSHPVIVWLLEALGIHLDIRECARYMIPLWRTSFLLKTSRELVSTGWVTYRREVFHRDSLSPPLSAYPCCSSPWLCEEVEDMWRNPSVKGIFESLIYFLRMILGFTLPTRTV